MNSNGRFKSLNVQHLQQLFALSVFLQNTLGKEETLLVLDGLSPLVLAQKVQLSWYLFCLIIDILIFYEYEKSTWTETGDLHSNDFDLINATLNSLTSLCQYKSLSALWVTESKQITKYKLQIFLWNCFNLICITWGVSKYGGILRDIRDPLSKLWIQKIPRVIKFSSSWLWMMTGD